MKTSIPLSVLSIGVVLFQPVTAEWEKRPVAYGWTSE